MSGEIEHCLDELNTKLSPRKVVVEGLGALNNMFYSGVTLGLLHGCMPDYLILTHELGRELDVQTIQYQNLARSCKCISTCLNHLRNQNF